MSTQESKTPSMADIRERHLRINGLSVNKSDVGQRIQKAAFDAMTEYASQCTAPLEERIRELEIAHKMACQNLADLQVKYGYKCAELNEKKANKIVEPLKTPRLVFANRINGTEDTGIVDIDALRVICRCSEEQSYIILEAFKAKDHAKNLQKSLYENIDTLIVLKMKAELFELNLIESRIDANLKALADYKGGEG